MVGDVDSEKLFLMRAKKAEFWSLCFSMLPFWWQRALHLAASKKGEVQVDADCDIEAKAKPGAHVLSPQLWAVSGTFLCP